MTFPFPNMYPGKTPVKLTYVKNVGTGADSTTYTILSTTVGDLGTPDPKRELLLICLWTYQSGTKTLSSVTVGSPAVITGTVFTDQTVFDGNGQAAAVIPCPTGSTLPDDIKVTFSAGVVYFSVYIIILNGRSVPGSNAVGATGTGSATSSSVSLAVPYNAAVVGVTTCASGTTITYADSGIGMVTGDSLQQDNNDTTTLGSAGAQTRGTTATITSSFNASRNWSAVAWALA
jgi:hypothetical protein